MSKAINFEIIALEDGYAVLETENGNRIDIDTELLPPNLREGRFLKFIISHNIEYSLDDSPKNPLVSEVLMGLSNNHPLHR